MHLLESHLQSKASAVPDDGGDDRIVLTEHCAAVIDGKRAKTDSKHLWNGEFRPPGEIGAEILAKAVAEMDPSLTASQACAFLDGRILQTYKDMDILDIVKTHPVERFSAIMALYSKQGKYVMLAGECQVIVGGAHYQNHKMTDTLNAEVRSKELHRLINEGILTEECLLKMDVNSDPGRKLILDPPPGSSFPGLRGQTRYQNNLGSPYGFFVFDGFADCKVPGFSVIDVPDYAHEVILASRGYIVPQGTHPADALFNLKNAEQNLNHVVTHDPCAYKLFKGTKGKGNDHSFDDRAYLRVAIQ